MPWTLAAPWYSSHYIFSTSCPSLVKIIWRGMKYYIPLHHKFLCCSTAAMHLSSPLTTTWTHKLAHGAPSLSRLPISTCSSSWSLRWEGWVQTPTAHLSGQLLEEGENGSPGSCLDWRIMKWGGTEYHMPFGEWRCQRGRWGKGTCSSCVAADMNHDKGT